MAAFSTWRNSKEELTVAAARRKGTRRRIGAAVAVAILCAPASGWAARQSYFANVRSPGTFVDSSTRDLVVLIHGWNSGCPLGFASSAMYEEDGWRELKANLKSDLVGTDWALSTYGWEDEAATGCIEAIGNLFWQNAADATDLAFENGLNIANVLDEDAPNLRRVHFIAHSAGSWAAWNATRHLLAKNPFVTVQVSLLDGFFPHLVPPLLATTYYAMTQAMMEGLRDLPGGERISRLDNYWSEEDITGPSTENDLDTWDISTRVDHDFILLDDAYSGHGGPIEFYSDTAYAATTGSFPEQLVYSDPPYDPSGVGWFRSLAHDTNSLPRIISFVQSPALAIPGQPVSLTLTAFNSSRPLYYEWLDENGQVVPSAPTTASFTFTATGADTYVVRVYDDRANSSVYSDAVTVAFAPQSDLTVSAVSTSQINLIWKTNASYFWSADIERSLSSSGPWAKIASYAGSTDLHYSDLGLSPNTTYFYRMRVRRQSFPEWVTAPASARTQSVASPTPSTLYLRSVNPSSGVNVQTWVKEGATNSQVVVSQTPTQTGRTTGALIGVACDPSLPSGAVFQKWLLDGVDYSYTSLTSVTLDTDHTLVAVYRSPTSPARILIDAEIEGPNVVNERSTAQYNAIATYSDGSAEIAPANWDSDSSYGTFSAAGVLDASAVTDDREIEISATVGYYGVVLTATKDVTIQNTDVVLTYTLNRSAPNGSISRSPSMSAYPSGTEVRLNASPDDGYLFSHWSGDASGTSRTTYITMNSNKSVTAHFVPDPNEATIRVFIDPAQANAAGAGWKASGNGYYPINYLSSGDDRLLAPGRYYVSYQTIPDWVEPDSHHVDLIGGNTTEIHATYRELKGSLQVTITPEAANNAGARWRIDDGPWLESGTTLSEVETGNHTLQFQPIAGWGAPTSRVVAIERNRAKAEYGNYDPPLGLPLITSISPSSGPLSGGTAVTIQGANFEPETTVMFDGVAATSVTVESSTQLTATTPAHDSYGSVPVAVTSNGQTATTPNGFAYLNAIGANIELVAQIGGNVEAVGVAGNLVYYGEGPGLVVSDFANSASPIERGRVPLPSTVKGIDISGSFVFAALGNAGLYAIDVSDPTAPAIVGFYDTEGSAAAIDVLDGVAYIADSNAGLTILDVADPEEITLLGSVDTAGRAESVSAGHIDAGTYAFVGEGDLALRVIDVTTPGDAAEVESVPAEGIAGIEDVKIVGGVLYVSDWEGGVKIFDASEPATLAQTGSRGNTGPAFIDVAGTRLYTCSGTLRVWDLTVVPEPAHLGTFELPGAFPRDLVVANGLAFAAMGRDGLQVASVSNPASMSLRSTLRTIGGVEDVYLLGDTLLVGNDAGLQTVDVANPLKPVWLATLSGDRVTDLVASDGKATLVNYGDEEVRIANVSNPAAPSLLGTYTGVEAWSVARRGTNPVLGAATPDVAHKPKLDILNLSNPASPQSLGSTTLGDFAAIGAAITTSGDWAFVGTWGWSGNDERRVDVVDLSNPAAPQKVGSLSVPELWVELAVSDDEQVVYAPLTGGGLGLIDVAIKTSPTFISAIDPPQTPGSNTQSVEVLGDRLYADDAGYLVAFDIEEPRSPAVIGYYDIPGTTNGLAARENLVFVAGGSAGVTILRVLDVDNPIVTINAPTINTTHQTTNDHLALAGVASDDVDVVRVIWNNDRGGGGIAEGTGSWSIPDVQLGSGINHITVTAEDDAGNHGSDILEVTATFPDTTSPVVAITGPKPDEEFSVETETIELSGSAADNEELAGVTWLNDRGGAGEAVISDGIWSVSDVPLELGPNLLEVTAIDTAGNVATDSAVVFMAPPDTEPPTVTIDFPTPNAELYVKENMLNVSGTAFDNVGVSGIDWAAGEEVGGSAEGTSPWFVNGIPLEPGLNFIDITAYDSAGNSSVDSLAVTFDPCAGADGDGNCSESFNETTKVCTAPDPNGSACDDGVFCNGNDTCSAGTCSNHAGDPCVLGTECADACNESADTCFDVAGTSCSGDASPCTLDQCDGLGACVHPAGNGGTVCRPSAGVCDSAETCTGTTSSCPQDALASSATVCRAAAGVCDTPENCTGTATACPTNAFASSATVCRAAGGVCDVGESCSGSSATCPADILLTSGSDCRASVGECDVPEQCNGASKACPANSFVPSGTGCGTDSNVCTDDVCNGGGACTHPANSAPCNDALFCNGADTCAGGACSSHAGNPCPGADNDGNCAETCSEVTDSCNGPDPDSSSCDDGDPCTKNDTCTAGVCAGVPGDGCGTTTTTIPTDPCGDPNGDGKITASDALAALGAAVGSRTCPVWICDFNGDGKVTAADALAVLRVAVGQDVLPQCPDAEPSDIHPAATVPTTAPSVSTTSTTIGTAP